MQIDNLGQGATATAQASVLARSRLDVEPGREGKPTDFTTQAWHQPVSSCSKSPILVLASGHQEVLCTTECGQEGQRDQDQTRGTNAMRKQKPGTYEDETTGTRPARKPDQGGGRRSLAQCSGTKPGQGQISQWLPCASASVRPILE